MTKADINTITITLLVISIIITNLSIVTISKRLDKYQEKSNTSQACKDIVISTPDMLNLKLGVNNDAYYIIADTIPIINQ